VMTGYSSVENAVEAMKLGATDFIKKPFDFEELRLIIDRTLRSLRLQDENRLLRKRLRNGRHRFGMIGETPVMRTLCTTIDKVAEVTCNVIITGESGTGKELVARALHDYSPRTDAPFVVIDCGALTETLLESELFGHEKGAFTGATQRKRGLMEQASGGTLFLDEISNISDAMQVKLMRAIEDQRITRVGSTVPVPIDLRVIAASNRSLDEMVKNGEFRHDFYHRLNVVNIRVPSLQARRDDIPALVEQFISEFAARYGRRVQGFDSVSMRRLYDADWPGNVRQLRNAVERCVILSEGPVLTWSNTETEVPELESSSAVRFPNDEFVSLEQLEHEYINHVLQHADGKKTKAARILGIDKTTLWRKLRRYEGS
jgi:DNA-binding NtrC family response regulator